MNDAAQIRELLAHNRQLDLRIVRLQATISELQRRIDHAGENATARGVWRRPRRAVAVQASG